MQPILIAALAVTSALGILFGAMLFLIRREPAQAIDAAKPKGDPAASGYVLRIRAEVAGLVDYLYSTKDPVKMDMADRICSRIYKPLRQVDGIVNGFED